ncbi:hypothetical protein [Streptomyces sp. NPDC059262]|uniref:hypothetical protein n=1 Tax=Streptomyces sp. NPDC059262 TaxID=3346797 RepID=UPI00368F7C50
MRRRGGSSGNVPVVKDALGWHIAFRVQTRQARPEPHTCPEIGIDAGVNLPLGLSDGNHQDHGRPPRLPDGKADRDKWLNPREKAKLLGLGLVAIPAAGRAVVRRTRGVKPATAR